MKHLNPLNSKIRDYLIQNAGLGGKSQVELASQFHTTSEIVCGVYRRWKASNTPVISGGQEGSMSLENDQDVDTLVASFDLAAKVRAALRVMPYKKYREDDVFRRTFSVGLERWRAATGRPEFGENKVELPNHRFVWCSEKTAKYLRTKLQDVV